MMRPVADKRPGKAPAVRRGSVFVEYVLLVTIVGIGVIVGLACVRTALVNELIQLANAINAITP
jgi:Flp pilus assembly pilin Flp